MRRNLKTCSSTAYRLARWLFGDRRMAGTRMLTVAALTCLAASQPALAQGAAKTGYDLTTNSQDTTASEHTVRYVLSLSPNPDGTATTFQLTDTLPPGTQYIHGSTHVPVDVKPSWSVDGTSFSTTEPTDTSGVTKLQFNASDYMVLKGKGHGGAVDSGAKPAVNWLAARLKGSPAKGNCR